MNARQQTLQGIAFPIEQDAIDRLHDIQAGRVNYVQLVRAHRFNSVCKMCTLVCFEVEAMRAVTLFTCNRLYHTMLFKLCAYVVVNISVKFINLVKQTPTTTVCTAHNMCCTSITGS